MPRVKLNWKPFLKVLCILVFAASVFEPSVIYNNRAGDSVMATRQIEDRHDGEIHVMTFNIRHGKGLDGKVNLKRIIAEIEQSGADIIGLQEVDRFNPRSGFVDQIRVLGEALGMYWVFAPSLQLGWTQYGNAILSKYPVISTQMFMLPSEHELRTVVQANILIGDHIVQLWNMHLGVSLLDRKSQMPILLDILADVEQPAIVVGDFNMEIEDDHMGGLKQLWSKVAVGQPTLLSGLEVDHIFTNGFFQLLSSHTQPTNASDHHPVIAELQLTLDPM